MLPVDSLPFVESRLCRMLLVYIDLSTICRIFILHRGSVDCYTTFFVFVEFDFYKIGFNGVHSSKELGLCQTIVVVVQQIVCSRLVFLAGRCGVFGLFFAISPLYGG